MKNALLPAGFYDLLYPDAGIQANIITKITDSFASFGYNRVNPPFIEFEETLLSGSGKSLEKQTFRLMDPISQNMMGIRTDMTVQVARIAKTRLYKEEMPLRLSYAGEVFRVKSEGAHAERQRAQAGIELIGNKSPNGDAEVILVAINTLKSIGIDDITVDFTLPGINDILLKNITLSNDERTELIKAIEKKDLKKINNIIPKQSKLFSTLLEPGLDIKSLKKISLPAEIKGSIKHLAEVIEIIIEQMPEVNISIDPAESLKFSYEQGIGFSIFASKAKSDIARGGRYVIETEKNLDAVGLTFYVNEIFRILPKQKPCKKILIPYGTPIIKSADLRQQGYITIHALNKTESTKEYAKKQGCSFIFEKNNLVSI